MGKINSLTSLRFFAAILIVIGHAGFYPGFENFKFEAINYSNAVSFFYVLSGFILAYTYKSMEVRSGYRKFLIARFARVWPLHAVMAFVCLFIFGPNIFLEYGRPYTSVFVTNIMLLQSWIPISKYYFSYNAVSWSISTEFAFYFFFPFFIFMARKYGRWLLLAPVAIPILIALICVILKLPLYEQDGKVSSSALLYVNPLSRLIEFTFGIFAWTFYSKINPVRWPTWKSNALEFSSLALLALSLILAKELWLSLKYTNFSAFGYWYAIAGSFVFFGLVVFVFALQKGVISSFLSKRFFVYLGEISFSIYMVHQVILNYLNAFHLSLIKTSPNLAYMIYWVGTITISIILYHCVEVPARNLIRKSLTKSKSEVSVVGQ